MHRSQIKFSENSIFKKFNAKDLKSNSIVGLHNTSAMKELFDELLTKCDSLSRMWSFLHWYSDDGIGMSDILECRTKIQNVIDNYRIAYLNGLTE